MAASHIFRIMFVNQGKVYEVYARRVSHGELFGFIEVEELLFGERSVLRIDEVKKQGTAKITVLESGANVAQFPMPMYSAPPGEKK